MAIAMWKQEENSLSYRSDVLVRQREFVQRKTAEEQRKKMTMEQ
jgi:hypothetical protein